MNTLEAAIYYASRGWPVLPLWHLVGNAAGLVCGCPAGVECGRDAGKHPACSGGVTSATTDHARVYAFWHAWADRFGDFPNVGVATALVLVVDLDAPHLGEETWSRIVEAHPRVDTVESQTGAGRHLWFDARGYGRVPCSVGRLGAGVDIRGAGGYVVAPPSLHRLGRVYGWYVDCDPTEGMELATAPSWLVDLARAPSRGTVARVAAGDVIASGSRNDTLARYACSLRARSVEEQELREAVERLNASACDPPLSAREVERLVRGVLRRYRPGLSPRALASAMAAELAAQRNLQAQGRYDFKSDPAWWAASTGGDVPADPEAARG